MAITKHLFGFYIQALTLNYYDYSAPVHVGLITSAWTPDWDQTFYWSQIQPYECADEGFSGGYNANGLTLQNQVLSTDPAKPFTVTTSPPIWEVLTATFRYVVFWTDGPVGALMIGGLDYGTDQVYTAQEFTIELPDALLSISAG